MAQINKKDVLNINSIKNKYLDLKYSDISESQKLDIYLPKIKKAKYPVIVFIHGGPANITTAFILVSPPHFNPFISDFCCGILNQTQGFNIRITQRIILYTTIQPSAVSPKFKN